MTGVSNNIAGSGNRCSVCTTLMNSLTLWRGRTVSQEEASDPLILTNVKAIAPTSVLLKGSEEKVTHVNDPPVESPYDFTKDFTGEQYLSFRKKHVAAFEDTEIMWEFLIWVVSHSQYSPLTPDKLHEIFQSIALYYQSTILRKGTREVKDGIILVGSDGSPWNECLQKLWEKKDDLILHAKTINPSSVKSRLKDILFSLNKCFTDEEILKRNAKVWVVKANPSSQKEAAEWYRFYLNETMKNQGCLSFLLPGHKKDFSAIERLLPIIPQFTISSRPSPFALKQSLVSFFESQNISGAPNGLDDVIMTIAASYYPDYKTTARELGLHPERGMILHGPPGTGKTVMAKAIAEYFGCPERRIKMTSGANLLDKWVGATEKGIRDLFKEAREDSENLHVIVIDEIDAILGSRNQGSTSWERSRVNQFLTELDGINSPQNVFVIGITNFVESLDTAAIRPGRLGTLIEVPLPNEKHRKDIFELYLKKVKREFLTEDYGVLAERLAKETQGFSGAEIKAVIQRTSNNAFMHIIRVRHFGGGNTKESQPTQIRFQDFLGTVQLIKVQKIKANTQAQVAKPAYPPIKATLERATEAA